MGYTHKTNPLLRARFQHMPFSKIKTPNTCNVAIFCVFDCNDSVRNEGGTMWCWPTGWNRRTFLSYKWVGGSLGDGVRVADGGGGPHAGLVMVSVKFLPLHKRLSTRWYLGSSRFWQHQGCNVFFNSKLAKDYFFLFTSSCSFAQHHV